MKGDFTRMTFRAEKHYTRVLKQQGRVDVDADWNEQNDILTHLDRTTRCDVIGKSGVPRDNAGFYIDEDTNGHLTFTPGRIYVDGILCEQFGDAPVRIDRQEEMAPGYDGLSGDGPFLVYLDVWERHVTHIEDPDIRETALGGPDTTTRVQTVFQVKLHPISFDEENEVPECRPYPAPAADGILRAQSEPPGTSDTPCVMGTSGGYRGFENRLYRVEIHQGSVDENGNPAQVTFKWSRDNGTVVLPVASEGFDGNTVTVLHTGKDNVLSVRPGDWVEVTNEVRDLSNLPGMVASINPDGVVHGSGLPRLELSLDVSAMESDRAPVVRRWDQKDTDDVTLVNGVVPISDEWIELEDGIQVSFDTSKTYHSGDYWLIPARTGSGIIDWPESNVDVPAMGIKHHYTTLATAWRDGKEWRTRDCRNDFPPLIDVGSGGCCIHIHPGESIQHALDRVIRAGGGCVVLCPGVHTISAPLLIDNAHDVKLRGCGWATILTTTLRSMNTLVTIRNCDRILIEDMLLTASTTRTLINLPQEGENRKITISKCGLVHPTLMTKVANTPSGIRITATNGITIEKCRIAAPVGIAVPLGDALPSISDLADMMESPLSLYGYSDFGDLPIESEYHVGDETVVNNIPLEFAAYQWGNNTIHEGGHADVRGGDSYAFLHTNNINAVFIPHQAVNSAEFIYNYDGGNVNVVVNSEILYAATPAGLDGQSVSNATVSVIPGTEKNYDQGRIIISSDIGMTRVGVGGQEFDIAAFAVGDTEPDELPDAEDYGLASQTVVIDDCSIRFSAVGLAAAIIEDVRIKDTHIESVDARLVKSMRMLTDTMTRAELPIHSRARLTDMEDLVLSLEDIFSQPVLNASGIGILGGIIDGIELHAVSITAGNGILAGLMSGAVIKACDMYGEKNCMSLVWPHYVTSTETVLFSTTGNGLLLGGGYAVKVDDCTINASTAIATLPSDVSASVIAVIISRIIRSLYGSISATQARGLIWLVLEDISERLDLEGVFGAFDSWLQSVIPGIPVTTTMLLAMLIEGRLEESADNTKEASKYSWPVSGISIDGCTLFAEKNSIQLTGLIPLGSLAVRNNRILSRTGRAVLCEASQFINSPEFVQTVFVGLLGKIRGLLEDRLNNAAGGTFRDLVLEMYPVIAQWYQGADDTFSTAVTIQGNTIESYRTAIETNLFQASVRNNHITMRQRLEIHVETSARINGIVMTSAGLPVPGASVTIVGTNIGTKTGSDGTFVLTDVEPGRIQLVATCAGFPVSQPTEITIASGEVREVTLMLSAVDFVTPYYGLILNRVEPVEMAFITTFTGNTRIQDTRLIEATACALENHALLTILAEEIREGGSTDPETLAAYMETPIAAYTQEEREGLIDALNSVAAVADEDTALAAQRIQNALTNNASLKSALSEFITALRKLSDSNGIVVRAPGCEISDNFIGVELTDGSSRAARGGIDISIDMGNVYFFLIISTVLLEVIKSENTEGLSEKIQSISRNPMKLVELLPRTIIDGNEIRGGTGHGITLICSPLLPEFVYGLSIHNNEISDQSGAGIYNNASAQLVDTSIQDNTIIRCSDARGYTNVKGGIVLDTCAGLTIKNNRIHGCGNDLSNMPVFGIDLSAIQLLDISGNSIVKNGSTDGKNGGGGGGGMQFSSVAGTVNVLNNICKNNYYYQVFWDGYTGRNNGAVNDTMMEKAKRFYAETTETMSNAFAQLSGNQLEPVSTNVLPTALLRYIKYLTVNANMSNNGSAGIPGFEISRIGHLTISNNQITGRSSPAMQLAGIVGGIITGNFSNSAINVDVMSNFVRSANIPSVI